MINNNLKVGQYLKLKGKYTADKVFKIIGFTPKDFMFTILIWVQNLLGT